MSKVKIDQNGYPRGRSFTIFGNGHSNLIHRQVAYREIYLKNRMKYPLPFREYVVHHIDEDKRNWSVDNLQLMTQKQHEQLHGYSYSPEQTSLLGNKPEVQAFAGYGKEQGYPNKEGILTKLIRLLWIGTCFFFVLGVIFYTSQFVWITFISFLFLSMFFTFIKSVISEKIE